MGLDFVELIMEVENRYVITLPGNDDDWASINTFGEFVELVYRRINELRNAAREEVNVGIVSAALVAQMRTLAPKGVVVNAETEMRVFVPALKRDECETWQRLQKRFPELDNWHKYCPVRKGLGCISFVALVTIYFTVHRVYIIRTNSPSLIDFILF